MKKMTKKILAIVSAILCVCSCGAIASSMWVSAENDVFKEEYLKGEKVEIPQRTLKNGSNSEKVSPTVYAPSGKIYTANSIVLREMGEYEVVYSAEINGKTITEVETFKSISPLYTIEGTGSYEYKANEKTPNTLGVNVELSSGSTFVYNKVIDLNNMPEKADILKLYVVPETIGVCDFRSITVTLTDIYDSANQVIITGNNVTDGYHDGIWDYEYAKYMMYMRAGTILSTPRGVDGSQMHIGNTYGYPSPCSFCGLLSDKLETDIFSFRFDYDTRKVLRNGGLVADLDDPAHFTDIWTGFTTGEVEMSIALSSYVSNKGTFVLTEIAGETLGDAMTFYDNEVPVIDVDYGEYTKETIPSVGIGQQYKLFKATAKDTYSGEIAVETKVYFDYEGAKETFAIENGCFTPTKAGIYTIEYSATDYCGNIAVETCQVEVESVYSLISATFKSGTKIMAGVAGEWISIAELSTNGGYGNLKTSVKVLNPKGKECEITDKGILPIQAGTYQVVYTVTDYVGQKKTVRYDIAISANDSPVFVDDVVLYRNYMNGYSYDLPALQAYKVDANGLTAVTTEIVVKDSQGERVLDNNVYVPVITENGTDIKITYRGICNGKTVSKEYEGKGYITKGDRGLMMEKFFITPASITATSKNDCLEYTTSTNGATMEFINPLLADGFSLMLNFSKMQTNASLKFVLRDFANEANTVEVKMADDNGNYSLWVNGEKHELSSFAPNADYYLVFDNLQSRVGLKDMAGATTYFSVSDEQYYFSSGRAYLSIEFLDITAKNTLILKQLNSQNLKTMAVDLLRPNIAIFSEVAGKKYAMGDMVIVSEAIGLDVLDPFVKTTLTIKDADGNVVKDCMTGVLLQNVPTTQQYQFIIEKIGDYTVMYQATDSQNRSTTFQYAVAMHDDEKPVLELSYDIVETAKIGDYVYVPEGKGTDNVDGEVTVYYCVITPDGVVHKFNRKLYDGFKVTTTGTYSIRYSLYDKYGNLAVYNYTIEVK